MIFPLLLCFVCEKIKKLLNNLFACMIVYGIQQQQQLVYMMGTLYAL